MLRYSLCLTGSLFIRGDIVMLVKLRDVVVFRPFECNNRMDSCQSGSSSASHEKIVPPMQFSATNQESSNGNVDCLITSFGTLVGIYGVKESFYELSTKLPGTLVQDNSSRSDQ